MKKLLLLLLAGLLACGFIACTSGPGVSTDGLILGLTRIERAGDGAVQVTWHVRNPNVVSYLFARSSHKLSLNGTVVGTFLDEVRQGLPAQSQMENTSRLILAGPGATAIIDQAITSGSVAYRLESTMTILTYDDNLEKFRLSASGNTPVTAK
jgi:hypothetical protein